MNDRDKTDKRRLDPESVLGYKLMIYAILAVMLVAILITILFSWISK